MTRAARRALRERVANNRLWALEPWPRSMPIGGWQYVRVGDAYVPVQNYTLARVKRGQKRRGK